jgi:urate oxidase
MVEYFHHFIMVFVTQEYGKDKVKLVKVTTAKGTSPLKHQHVHELTVCVLLSGDKFETSYSKADNSLVGIHISHI